MKPLIYAMTGGNGSGKTTYALKVSKEIKPFFSLEKIIKNFNQPIQALKKEILLFLILVDEFQVARGLNK